MTQNLKTNLISNDLLKPYILERLYNMNESILKNLKSDPTYYDRQFPELSTMIARAGIKITPFKDLTGDQQAYAKTYRYEHPQNDQLIRYVGTIHLQLAPYGAH